MALTNATVKTGGTISVTGGTTVTFAPSGKEVPEGLEIIDINAADYRTRHAVTVSSKVPSYNAGTGQYSGGKNKASVIKPVILADGSTFFPTIRVEVTWHPEMTDADRLDLRKIASQILVSTDFETFWKTGSKI